jgi:hypothetical protein
MTQASFEDLVLEQGWGDFSQVTIMKRFIEEKGLAGELSVFAAQIADVENGFEGGLFGLVLAELERNPGEGKIPCITLANKTLDPVLAMDILSEVRDLIGAVTDDVPSLRMIQEGCGAAGPAIWLENLDQATRERIKAELSGFAAVVNDYDVSFEFVH